MCLEVQSRHRESRFPVFPSVDFELKSRLGSANAHPPTPSPSISGRGFRRFQDPALELQYKTCYARVSDAKGRFVEAAMRYYELSQAEPEGRGAGKSEARLAEALSNAITCAILASAGPQRSLTVNPPASHVLEQGHLLVVMGLMEDLQKLPRT